MKRGTNELCAQFECNLWPGDHITLKLIKVHIPIHVINVTANACFLISQIRLVAISMEKRYIYGNGILRRQPNNVYIFIVSEQEARQIIVQCGVRISICLSLMLRNAINSGAHRNATTVAYGTPSVTKITGSFRARIGLTQGLKILETNQQKKKKKERKNCNPSPNPNPSNNPKPLFH